MGDLSKESVAAAIRANAAAAEASSQRSFKDDLADVARMAGLDSIAGMLKSAGVSHSTPSGGQQLSSCAEAMNLTAKTNSCARGNGRG